MKRSNIVSVFLMPILLLSFGMDRIDGFLEKQRGQERFKKRGYSPVMESKQAVDLWYRLDVDGDLYNYASSSNGAKILSSNNEAEGVSNILNSDKNKFLQNPCSAEEKFFVIELSEEISVLTFDVVNFEQGSSYVKDFEVQGSLVYPTDSWTSLANVKAPNRKSTQRLVLEKPTSVRYLRFDLKSHHGSEDHCTLNSVKVYGVEDWNSIQEHEDNQSSEPEIVRDGIFDAGSI